MRWINILKYKLLFFSSKLPKLLAFHLICSMVTTISTLFAERYMGTFNKLNGFRNPPALKTVARWRCNLRMIVFALA